MATITVCDKCETTSVQLTTILGRDICAECVSELRKWLDLPMQAPKRGGRIDRYRQAIVIIRRNGYVSSELMADANKEPTRRAYDCLHALHKAGKLVHKGSGVFVLPEAAAE